MSTSSRHGILKLGLLLAIGLLIIACQPVEPTPPLGELSAPSFEELKQRASSPTYDDLFRNNERHIGNLVYYQAQIIQVIDEGQDRYQLRVNVTKGQFLWDDTVFLRYAGPRFLKNDIIEFVGTVAGLITYKSVLGGPITIPDVSIVKAKLVSKAGGTNGGTRTTPAPSPSPTPEPIASTLTTPISTLIPVPTPTPTPTGPRTSFSDGVWIIGVDIAPGTYRNSNPSGTCYWKRLKGLGGTSGELIAIERSPYTQTVSISPSDAGFDSSLCGTWSLAPTSGPSATSFSDGVWIIGVDIAPGTYRNSNPSGTCYWKRLKGLGGTSRELIAIERSPYTQTVSISPSDAGFYSSDCGTWTRIAQ